MVTVDTAAAEAMAVDTAAADLVVIADTAAAEAMVVVTVAVLAVTAVARAMTAIAILEVVMNVVNRTPVLAVAARVATALSPENKRRDVLLLLCLFNIIYCTVELTCGMVVY